MWNQIRFILLSKHTFWCWSLILEFWMFFFFMRENTWISELIGTHDCRLRRSLVGPGTLSTDLGNKSFQKWLMADPSWVTFCSLFPSGITIIVFFCKHNWVIYSVLWSLSRTTRRTMTYVWVIFDQPEKVWKYEAPFFQMSLGSNEQVP